MQRTGRRKPERKSEGREGKKGERSRKFREVQGKRKGIKKKTTQNDEKEIKEEGIGMKRGREKSPL